MGKANTKMSFVYAKALPDSKTESFTDVYKSPGCFELSYDKTLYSIFETAANSFHDLPFVGYFDTVFKWITYEQAFQMGKILGQSLANIPKNPLAKCFIVGICSGPRYENLIVDIALMSQSMASIFCGKFDDLEMILEKTQVRIMFCEEKCVKNICKAKTKINHCKLKYLILYNPLQDHTIQLIENSNLKPLLLSDLISSNPSLYLNTPKPNTPCSIFFSPSYSFTIINHHHIISTLEGMNLLKSNPNENYYSYINYSVFTERILIYFLLKTGAKIAFGENFIDSFDILNPTVLHLNRYFLKYFCVKAMNKTEVQKIKGQLNRVNFLVTSSPGIREEMIKMICEKMVWRMIRIFGNYLCGAMIVSYNFDGDLNNSGGPIGGLEISIKTLPNLFCGRENSDFKGVLYAKGPSLSTFTLSLDILDTGTQGIDTKMLCEISPHNGSLVYLADKYWVLESRNGETLMLQLIESVYLMTNKIQEIFVYEGYGKVLGVVIGCEDFEVDMEEFEYLLEKYERVQKWLFVDFTDVGYMPYYIARNEIYKRFLVNFM
ncbi:hypothetical protein SteCoe_13700 [Stentor coeruleus]|uniref:Uncharacterized protein n=1 Tax=Stentor coeruleus TaxID=5963 RepID=A0A1R2C7R3_9CILI|nr:hypothetical protein SteCoe_13700 [Stentor coeruleus]